MNFCDDWIRGKFINSNILYTISKDGDEPFEKVPKPEFVRICLK
jgi:hypothetical protein